MSCHNCNQDDVDKIICQLEQYLQEGWSIQLALKKACGSVYNKMSLYVRRDPRYLNLLNQYASKKDKNLFYAANEKGELYQVRTASYPHTKKI